MYFKLRHCVRQLLLKTLLSFPYTRFTSGIVDRITVKNDKELKKLTEGIG